jgi:riboflavin synthase
VFTGIVEETGNVVAISPDWLEIAACRVLEGTKLGDSLAVNGVCLTITDLNEKTFTADIMTETSERTNLGLLKKGEIVNLERALTLCGRLSGHLVQGHVDATGRVSSLQRQGEAVIIKIETIPRLMSYIVEKGFIAVDGISLTVMAKAASSFQVSVVAFTTEHTSISRWRIGDTVNLEVDIIAKYVESLNGARKAEITSEFLQEHGFLVS